MLVPAERHLELLRRTVAETAQPSGNLFHDIASAVLMREHGIREIASADTG